MNWQPIETYDALPPAKRPKFAAFLFAEVPPRRMGHTGLARTVELTRNFGSRTCTHWFEIANLPEPPA